MLNVMILEDSDRTREALSEIVKSISCDIRVFSASTYQQAVQLLQTDTKFQLFLLDVNLQADDPRDAAGITYAKNIRKQQEYIFTPIVFITSVSNLEMISYRTTQCYKYLVKPYRKEEVENIVKSVMVQIEKQDDRQLTIKKEGINYRISIHEILYIRAVSRGIELVLNGESVSVKYMTLKQILESLNTEEFIQCHRMFIISVAKIEYVDMANNFVKLRGVKAPIEIGVTFRAELRRWIKNGRNHI